MMEFISVYLSVCLVFVIIAKILIDLMVRKIIKNYPEYRVVRNITGFEKFKVNLKFMVAMITPVINLIMLYVLIKVYRSDLEDLLEEMVSMGYVEDSRVQFVELEDKGDDKAFIAQVLYNMAQEVENEYLFILALDRINIILEGDFNLTEAIEEFQEFINEYD